MQLNDESKFANITDVVVLKLRKRYPSMHPLLFLRSAERAASVSELFDILETVPPMPVTWSEEKRCWVTATDLLLSNN
jgi:hypothetical protein